MIYNINTYVQEELADLTEEARHVGTWNPWVQIPDRSPTFHVDV